MESEVKIRQEQNNNETEKAPTKTLYPDKGGHFLRSRYWKAMKALTSQSETSFRSMIVVPVDVSWQRRRFMPRHGINDGRR